MGRLIEKGQGSDLGGGGLFEGDAYLNNSLLGRALIRGGGVVGGGGLIQGNTVYLEIRFGNSLQCKKKLFKIGFI